MLAVAFIFLTSCTKTAVKKDNQFGFKELSADPSGVTTPAPPGQSNGNQSVTGGGTANELGEKSTFVFNAIKKADGSVTGQLNYHVRAQDISFKANVNCVTIAGDEARITGIVTSVNGPQGSESLVGRRITFFVKDYGQGAGAPPDKISDMFFTGNVACNVMRPDLIYLPVSGNIQVNP